MKETDLDYQKLTMEMRKLALIAGDAIMDIYKQDDLGIDTKDDASPVTKADKAADDIISSGLKKAFPNTPLVTEEQASSHDISAKTFLIVDPLDGTKEFIKRRGEFTVNIAYVENGNPTRGVVYAPAKERMFLTDHSGQAYEEQGPFDPNAIGTLKKLSVSTPNNNALTVVASKSHRDQATDDYIAKYNVVDMISAGSSLKFCLIAAGEADFYPRLGRTMEWDTAAGHAVLNGAGGKVLQFDTQETLNYGKSGFENPFFLALSPNVILK